jgi:hypothetical protein
MTTPEVDPVVLDLLLLPLNLFLTIVLAFFVTRLLAREAPEGRREGIGNGAGRRTAAWGLPNECLEESLAVQVPLPSKPPVPTLLMLALPPQVLMLPGSPGPALLPPAELRAPAPQAQVPKLQGP